jgi:hypothetical protein
MKNKKREGKNAFRKEEGVIDDAAQLSYSVDSLIEPILEACELLTMLISSFCSASFSTPPLRRECTQSAVPIHGWMSGTWVRQK